jgi:hypothetical protein
MARSILTELPRSLVFRFVLAPDFDSIRKEFEDFVQENKSDVAVSEAEMAAEVISWFGHGPPQPTRMQVVNQLDQLYSRK